MTDDHTQQAMSAYEDHLIRTPNLDRIAEEGILFTQSFVTNSICAPSRAVMLTGKYSHMNGLRDNRDVFDTDQMTFPKLLQEAGYYTALVGKWHLKRPPTGFDYWNVLPDQGDYYNPDLIEMGDTSRREGYVTNVITDLALDVLEKRDTTRPFCMLVHHKAPHRSWLPDTAHLDLFTEKIPEPPTLYDDYSGRTAPVREQDMRIADMFLSMDMKLQPEFYDVETGTGGNRNHNAPADWAKKYGRLNPAQKTAWDAHYDEVGRQFQEANLSEKALTRWKYQRYMEDYLRCVISVDDNVGRLLDYLDDQGLSENTLVIYTSDQGFYLGEHGWYDKRFMYEESLSMPLAMRYPSMIPAGSIDDHIVLNLDFAPTILDLAGVTVPEDMQGRSLRPVLTGEEPGDWRESMYYHYYQSGAWHYVPKHYGVRTDRYKLLHYYEEGTWEMYDLEVDPNELHSVYSADEYADVQSELEVELERLREYYGVPEE